MRGLLPFKQRPLPLGCGNPARRFLPVSLDDQPRAAKGGLLPVPLLCEVAVGPALYLNEGEEKAAFLQRTQAALLALAPNAAEGETSAFSTAMRRCRRFNPQAGWVLAAIFGVLLLASAIAAALKWRLHGQANASELIM